LELDLLRLLGSSSDADVMDALNSPEMSSYERRLDGVLRRGKTQTRESQNICIPPTDGINWDRRKPAEDSLQVFLETYFPEIFFMKWSEDHLRMIRRLERAVIQGELSAFAMSRGAGKTAIIIRAAEWAILTGRRNYVAIVAATQTRAQSLLKSIKTEILHNERLRQDFAPELWCLTSLGNRASLSAGQHAEGELTGVEWNVDHINFGYIDHPMRTKVNNAVLVAFGITGDIRGEQTTTPFGEIRRPDLLLVDDPQTKTSAGSKMQVQKRYETLLGDALGLAGPGKSIAGLAAITVIYKNDLSDRLLDREASPVWQGDRCKMVYQWPDREDLWDEYQAIYENELRSERGHEVSLNFIADNYDDMHRGSEVGWEARYDPEKELSALHCAYNLKIRDEGAFAAEYQNEPMEGRNELAFELNVVDLMLRTVAGLQRDELPEDCEVMTAAVDVQGNALYYMVCAWSSAGRCNIVDYGTFPDQKRMYFSKTDIQRTLKDVVGTDEEDAAIAAGLHALAGYLLSKEYETGDGRFMMIDKMAVDSAWNTELIRRFCRESEHKSRLHPGRGMYIGCNSRKWQKLKVEKREKPGIHCKLVPPGNRQRGRAELLIDTNFWKTWAADRLSTTITSTRAIVLFADKPASHRMIAEHWVSETPSRKEGKSGDIVTEWEQPKHVDNEWWDTLVYNGALASTLSVKTHEATKDGRRTTRPSRDDADPTSGGLPVQKKSAAQRMSERRNRARGN